MRRFLFYVALAALVAAPFGCNKKGKDGGGNGGPVGKGGDIAKFDEATAHFREAIRFVSLTPDKDKAVAEATVAETAFADVAKGWPAEAPDRYEADTEWSTRIKSLKKLMGDIKTQVGAGKTEDAEASILETQKLLLALDEKNEINSVGDETIRIMVLTDEMGLAFHENRPNDMKHLMPNLWEAQKNFFGSPAPPSASGREDEFDNMKDRVYEAVDTFAEASNPVAREQALVELIKATREFYVEFG